MRPTRGMGGLSHILPATILLGSCGKFWEVVRKVAKLSAIETIEEFSIFAGSPNVLRPPFELRRSPLILFEFLAALLALAVYSRVRGPLRTYTAKYGSRPRHAGRKAPPHGSPATASL